ncbi:hypothetical protein [Endozoicomonas lisbonensis]|uniref:Uncharacterized protein n=1 Tax=Endozoicomonas lisbonensis TaxID=3120522 RepID=A0ABV2SP62_9GAMM
MSVSALEKIKLVTESAKLRKQVKSSTNPIAKINAVKRLAEIRTLLGVGSKPKPEPEPETKTEVTEKTDLEKLKSDDWYPLSPAPFINKVTELVDGGIATLSEGIDAVSGYLLNRGIS